MRCAAEAEIRRAPGPGARTAFGVASTGRQRGHDAWIVGDSRCVLIDFTGVAQLMRKAGR